MQQTRMIMGMPVILEILGPEGTPDVFERVFDFFEYVDRKFSPFKPDSELSQLNRGELELGQASQEMQDIFQLAEQTRLESDGYFEIRQAGRVDPSGIVKGWAIYRAAELLREAGCVNFSVYAGGDIQVSGQNAHGGAWRIGIQNPFNPQEIVKVLALRDCGIATSGTYARGAHIYNPRDPQAPVTGLVSLSVIGPNVYEADRFATAAFAMGPAGIDFIERLEGLEGYMIDPDGLATYTSGFERYVVHA